MGCAEVRVWTDNKSSHCQFSLIVSPSPLFPPFPSCRTLSALLSVFLSGLPSLSLYCFDILDDVRVFVRDLGQVREQLQRLGAEEGLGGEEG